MALDEDMTTSCRSAGACHRRSWPCLLLLAWDIVESESGQNSEEISSYGGFGAGSELETLPEGDQEIVKVEEVSQVTKEEILKNFTLAEQALIMFVPAASNVEDLAKFGQSTQLAMPSFSRASFQLSG